LPILWYTLHHGDSFGGSPFMIMLFMSYTLLSYLSFNLDSIDEPDEDNRESYRFFRMLYYAFYMPYMVSIIVRYSDFRTQLRDRTQRRREWRSIALFAARIAFWWLFIEFMLHFFYFEAVLRDLKYAYSLTEDRFVSLGMAIGEWWQRIFVAFSKIQAA
jgi:hypothetical protein